MPTSSTRYLSDFTSQRRGRLSASRKGNALVCCIFMYPTSVKVSGNQILVNFVSSTCPYVSGLIGSYQLPSIFVSFFSFFCAQFIYFCFQTEMIVDIIDWHFLLFFYEFFSKYLKWCANIFQKFASWHFFVVKVEIFFVFNFFLATENFL